MALRLITFVVDAKLTDSNDEFVTNNEFVGDGEQVGDSSLVLDAENVTVKCELHFVSDNVHSLEADGVSVGTTPIGMNNILLPSSISNSPNSLVVRFV